ncbi:hypothetical protein L1987_55447 [Smallanthus sonchifolius]|uniref:Uncharacterized protein n=1 Tax=Smallanthus sonchifolius TaxID=185202 RepID=A0ACB9E9Y6_9ASTR|nr:hypothetical protein L1987_55447 [Smallanthus sonchifolius]
MYRSQRKTDLPLEIQPILRTSIHARRANIVVKFQDPFGFMVEGNVDDVNILNDVREKMREQEKVWWTMDASKGVDWYLQTYASSAALKSSLSFSVLVNAMALKKLIRKGIPTALRPKVWFSLSGAAKKKSTVPDSYYNDLTFAVQDKVTPATKQIDHGLNYVAALLLLVMKTEEEAFWMLAVLLENVLVNDCYTDNLSGCHVDQRVFKDMLTKKCPRLSAHLETIGFDVSLVATEWFLCLFSKSLPSETTMRVWDVLFYEGAKVLFNIALAVFKMKEEELLMTHHVGDAIKII